ncbi:hypothetical protein D3C71_1643540 [compost metagenome]
MFRRNADTIQGTCDTRVERLLDLVELKLDLALESAHFVLGFVDLGIRRFEFLSDYFFAFLFNSLTSFYQLLKVLAALLPDLGVGAQACQPDFAGIGFDVAQSTGRCVDFFLQNHFGHGPPHAQKV